MMNEIFIYITTFFTMIQNNPYTPFLSGNEGFYTSRASFKKVGQIELIFRESYGLKGEGNDKTSQTTFNSGYTLFPFIELEAGIDYLSMEGKSSKKGIIKTKLPFLSINKIKSSLSPSVNFTEGEKPFFTAGLNIEIIPFFNKTLPDFLLSQSIRMGKKYDVILQYSSFLTLDTKTFQPFIEFYTELNKDISLSSSNKTFFCSGLGYKVKNSVLRGGVEIALEEKSKRLFDYRFTAEINYNFNIRKRYMSKLFIKIVDKETEKPITATVTLKGHIQSRTIECKDGKCNIEDLPVGIYTIEIKNPDYNSLRMPIFIKGNITNKTYKLTKKP